jgi:hypothetical protein
MGEVHSDENPYWTVPRDRNSHTVRFGHFLTAYEPHRTIPNVELFVRQITDFARLANEGVPALNPSSDPSILIGLGRCLSVIGHRSSVVGHR